MVSIEIKFSSLLSKIGFFFGQHLKPINTEIQSRSRSNLPKQAYFAAIGAWEGCRLPISQTLAVLGQHLQEKTTWIPNSQVHCVKSSTYMSKKPDFDLFWTVVNSIKEFIQSLKCERTGANLNHKQIRGLFGGLCLSAVSKAIQRFSRRTVRDISIRHALFLGATSIFIF